MTLPKKVKIGVLWYDVKLTTRGLDIDDCGLIDHENKTIVINPHMPIEIQEGTLLHEAMHAMNHTIDHELLDSLAEQIYTFLKENKIGFR